MRRLQITLEVVPGSEPITGTVSAAATPRSFTGWMELITALQAAIQEDTTHPSERGTQ